MRSPCRAGCVAEIVRQVVAHASLLLASVPAGSLYKLLWCPRGGCGGLCPWPAFSSWFRPRTGPKRTRRRAPIAALPDRRSTPAPVGASTSVVPAIPIAYICAPTARDAGRPIGWDDCFNAARRRGGAASRAASWPSVSGVVARVGRPPRLSCEARRAAGAFAAFCARAAIDPGEIEYVTDLVVRAQRRTGLDNRAARHRRLTGALSGALVAQRRQQARSSPKAATSRPARWPWPARRSTGPRAACRARLRSRRV